MVLNPCRQNIVPQEFLTVIDWAFTQSQIDVLLGGSCVLSEFYLGHRQPEDVDFFVSRKEDLKAFKTALSEAFKIGQEEIIKRASSYRYIVQAGEQEIVVHCALSEKLISPQVRARYTTEFESFKFHTPDFIGAWKLSRRQKESISSCTKKVIDLYFLTGAGVTCSDFLSVLYAFKMEPRKVVNWPYRCPYYDETLASQMLSKPISSSRIDQFVGQFTVDVEAILRGKKQEK